MSYLYRIVKDSLSIAGKQDGVVCRVFSIIIMAKNEDKASALWLIWNLCRTVRTAGIWQALCCTWYKKFMKTDNESYKKQQR